MANQIIPAILGENFNEVSKKLALVEGLVEWAHIDVCDGVFAEGFTWDNPQDLFQIEGKTKIAVHLMVDRPEEIAGEWLEVADRVIIHAEATDKIGEIIEIFNGRSLMLGVALKLETPIEEIEPFMAQVKNVHLMSIAEIGHHGEPFEESVIEKIKTLRQKYPSVIIGVDGGVNLENAKSLLDAGVNELIVGSALWKSKDIAETIKEFQSLYE